MDLTNNVGAEGFSPGIFTHDYLVVAQAPRTLAGPNGLSAIGAALVTNPTPGKDRRSTVGGTVNDVGPLFRLDPGPNLVRSYSVPASRPDRSVAVVNYTVDDQHTMDEGFVLRFAEFTRGGRIVLVTYGEGNAIKQSFLTSFIWRSEVERIWLANAREVFAAAARGGRQ